MNKQTFYEPCTFSEGKIFAETEDGVLPLRPITLPSYSVEEVKELLRQQRDLCAEAFINDEGIRTAPEPSLPQSNETVSEGEAVKAISEIEKIVDTAFDDSYDPGDVISRIDRIITKYAATTPKEKTLPEKEKGE